MIAAFIYSGRVQRSLDISLRVRLPSKHFFTASLPSRDPSSLSLPLLQTSNPTSTQSVLSVCTVSIPIIPLVANTVITIKIFLNL